VYGDALKGALTKGCWGLRRLLRDRGRMWRGEGEVVLAKIAKEFDERKKEEGSRQFCLIGEWTKSAVFGVPLMLLGTGYLPYHLNRVVPQVPELPCRQLNFNCLHRIIFYHLFSFDPM
jgi:hypothetical protein